MWHVSITTISPHGRYSGPPTPAVKQPIKLDLMSAELNVEWQLRKEGLQNWIQACEPRYITEASSVQFQLFFPISGSLYFTFFIVKHRHIYIYTHAYDAQETFLIISVENRICFFPELMLNNFFLIFSCLFILFYDQMYVHLLNKSIYI